MYGSVAGASTVTVGTGAALILPNTGSNRILTIAVSVAAGLVVWGALQARARRQAAKR